MTLYNTPGSETHDISGTGPIAADDEIIRLALSSSDSRCARSILYAFHEALATIIASNSETVGCFQSTIHAEISKHIQNDHHVCKAHRREVEQIVQEWVMDLTDKVIRYSQRASSEK